MAMDSNGHKEYFVVIESRNANVRDFEFKVAKVNDIGLYRLDLTLPDLPTAQDIMQTAERDLLWVNHFAGDVRDLGVAEDASLRVKFGHLKYYEANSKLESLRVQNDVCFVCFVCVFCQFL